jgi:phage terminase Nu1 subunit (DNA packaging protein)
VDLSATDLSDLLGDEPATPSPAIVHESELAALLGISRQAVAEHVRTGVLVRVGRARFDMADSVRRYCSHLRTHAARAGRPSEGGDALKAERLRLTRAQAEAQEQKNRLAAGELVPVVEVRREWVTAATDLRNALLAVPGRLQARLGLTAEQAEAADAELRLALETLADG